MKSIVLSSVVMALLVFSGCADKEPAVDEVVTQKLLIEKDIEYIQTETVSSENALVSESSSSASNTDSSEEIMAKLEKEMTTVYFDYDKFNIRSDMQDRVTNSASLANGNASDYTIKLEGNCDEWGSDEYNFALGLKRASTVKNALVSEGVSSHRITMVSYGESNPVCNDKTKDCWAQNRRVDFKLLP